MQKFLVLYMAPAAEMEEWMKKPIEERKAAEDKMKADWDTWMAAHGAVAAGMTAGVGKTKRVSKEGVVDTKNDIMLSSMIEAESHEAAADMFKDHPHFGIPNATIEVMPLNVLPGTAK